MKTDAMIRLQLRTLDEIKGRPKAGWYVSMWYGAIGENPKLAAFAARAIAISSYIDAELVDTLVGHCPGDPELLAAIWAGFNSTSPQDTVLLSAAQHILQDPEDLRLYTGTVNRIVRPNRAARNWLAHWLWARSPELPSALLLVNPAFARKDSASTELELRNWRENTSTDSLEDPPWGALHEGQGYENVLVLKENDLRRIARESSEVFLTVRRLQAALQPKWPGRSLSRRTLLKQLGIPSTRPRAG